MSQFEREHELDAHTELFNPFLEFALGKYESDRSYKTRERGVRAWLCWCEDDEVDPLRVGEGDIHSYVTGLNREYADTTIASRVSSITVFYDWAISEPTIDTALDENPTSDLNLKDRFGVDPQVKAYHFF